MFKYKLIGECNFGSEIKDILRAKGINEKDINSFIKPNENHIESPYLLDDIGVAGHIFDKHIHDDTREIDIVVDDDGDGFTSSALMYLYIKKINPKIRINYYIHEKKVHAIEDLLSDLLTSNADLVIIPDAGTGDIKECKKLKELNKDVIILDHHKIDKRDNPAIVVNNQLSELATDKSMTGVGIVYKFCKLLDEYYKVNYADDYLDLVAIGMISDSCDLHNLQSRYYVFEGLKMMNTENIGNKLINILIERCSYHMGGDVTLTGVSFSINPLINSLIRLGTFEDKCIMFEALCNSNKIIQRKIKGQVVDCSLQRYTLLACEVAHRKQQNLTTEYCKLLGEQITKYKLDNNAILMCNSKNILNDDHLSLTGLIANKLTDVYKKPCLLLQPYDDNKIGHGSGRGFIKSNILNFNEWCKNTGLFKLVAGHDNAFGIRIFMDKIRVLYSKIKEVEVSKEFIYHVHNIFNETTLSSDSIKNLAKYNYLWGCGIDEPLFLLKDINCNKYSVVLTEGRQYRLEIKYKNIIFIKYGNDALTYYKQINDLGDFISFDIIGKFNIDKDKNAIVYIEDLMCKKGKKISVFG